MPKPHVGRESESEWMHRCVPVVIADNTAKDQDQAVAICSNMWREAGGKQREVETMSSSKRSRSRMDVPFEVKSLGSREFEGYGSTFGNVDLGGDIVMKGAFQRSLDTHTAKGTLPAMFFMHDPSKIPGKWLEMAEDDAGLYVRGVLAPTPLGEEMHALLKMDAVRGLSIGYQVEDDAYDKAGNRLLKEIDLWETSLVSLAMNPMASVTHVKSQLSAIGEFVPTAREMEQRFRDMGCSQKVAKQLVAKLFGNGESTGTADEPQRDADDSELDGTLEKLCQTLMVATMQKVKL